MQRLTTTLLLLFLPLAGAADLQSVLSDPNRGEADQARDAGDDPAALFEFAGVEPGHTVLDLFAGTGYNSELAAAVVGPDGHVIAHNNAAYLQFAEEGLVARLAAREMPNLERLDAELEAIAVAPGSVDVVLLILTYHDIYFKTDGWDLRAEPLFAKIREVLKPGGTLLITDHHAEPGSGTSAAQDLHRIDAAYARQEIESHGFALAASSELLTNADDDLQVSVFDPSVRGKTSRFAFRFVLADQQE